jgi:aromatic-L-amino-acid/L-tryptophan decarboxylase
MSGAPQLPGAWGWDEATIGTNAQRMVALALDHLLGQRERPVFEPVPASLGRRWSEESWSEEGCGSDELLEELARSVLPHPFGNGHPRFHGWVNPPPDRAAVFASLLAAAMNPSCAGGNHAALHLERQVVRWLSELVGLPAGSGGLLVSGGSMATLTALAAARQAGAGFDVREHGLAGQVPLRVYATSEAHSCVTKAVELLGLGRTALQSVATDAHGRMDADALDTRLGADARGPGRPLAVVASAGTVNTGAIDPLGAIADVCARHRVWLHVDGSYGAPAVLVPELRPLLDGLERADSLTLDPHKWLYVPIDAGVVLVRRPEQLRDTFSLVPPYLRVDEHPGGVSDTPWLSEYGPEQTRPFRALRLWAAMRTTGRAGYRRLIEHDLVLAGRLARAIDAADGLELLSHGLSIVCFRCRADGTVGDELQDEVARRIQTGGSAFLTTTSVAGRRCLRACILNPLTTEADLDDLIRLVCRAAEEAHRPT